MLTLTKKLNKGNIYKPLIIITIMGKLEYVISWEEFINNFRKDNENIKLGETARAYWGSLSLLLDPHSMEGLYPQEIVNSLKKLSSKPTLVKALNQLKVWGFIERTPKRWIANKQTGMAFKQIDNSFSAKRFSRPSRKYTKNKGKENEEVLTFPCEPAIQPSAIAQIIYKNNDISINNLKFTGSVFLDEPVGKQKDLKELIESGHAVEFRGIFKPAGTQPQI